MASLSVRNTNGFGLLDLMLALVVASLLAALAVPVYGQFATRARVAKAIGDIGSISVQIESFRLRNNDTIPNSLDELPGAAPLIILSADAACLKSRCKSGSRCLARALLAKDWRFGQIPAFDMTSAAFAPCDVCHATVASARISRTSAHRINTGAVPSPRKPPNIR